MSEGPTTIPGAPRPVPPPPPLPPKPPQATGFGALRVSLMPTDLDGKRRFDPRRQLIIMAAVLLAESVVIGATYGVIRNVISRRQAELQGYQTRIDAAEKKIKELQPQAKELAAFSARSEAVVKTLERHVYATKLLSLLAKRTQPDVRYSAASIDFERNTIILQAEAKKYRDVVRQVLTFRQTPEFIPGGVAGATAMIDDVGHVTGVKFNAPLKFAPEAARFGQTGAPEAIAALVDCGTDKSYSEMYACLDIQFAGCLGAYAEVTEGETAKIRYEIRGSRADRCEIRFSYLNHANPSMINLEADCSLDKSKPFHTVMTDLLSADFASCQGKLPAFLKLKAEQAAAAANRR